MKKIPEKGNNIANGAIIQRDLETYSVSPHIAGGFCNPATLRKIADIAEKYGAEYLKITGSQRIALIGVREEDLERIWSDLGEAGTPAVGPCVRSIKICPGTRSCKKAVQNSIDLGMALDRKFFATPMPAKFKMGVSGCPNCCSDSWIKDIGFFGTGKGFKILVGGKGGRDTRTGKELVSAATVEECMQITGKIIDLYRANAKEKERLGPFIDRFGFEEFKKVVLR